MARPRCVPLIRMTPASPPGPCIVLVWTIESYCSWIQVAPAFITIERHGQTALRALDTHDAGLTAWSLHRVGLDHRIVLLVDPGSTSVHYHRAPWPDRAACP